MSLLDMIKRFLELSITGFIAVIMAITPREYIKARLALMFGDQTPKKVGRVSLNPFVHLDPIGTVTFIFLDFGWSRPVPIRPWNLRGKKKTFLFVSLSGPAVGVLCFVIYGYLANAAAVENKYVFETLYKAAKFSLTYSLFSLFPIPPLDGSKVLGALLPENYTEWYLKYEVYGVLFMLALLVLWIMPLVMNPFVDFIDKLTNLVTS
ncbi:peptidase M50 [Pseudothermotoga lettingae TMO]|uniref:Peptidase M50 n=3 Tax=Pseudothermotoga TaxID=1643951 RepID=A8F6X9_PSELT|nr:MULTISPECIES: site-2 protease family protein [Pseudothermotoga]ABV33913.1 peptidase M50 [Pseudothermotoga lettingae TMO]GLI49150.1 peptidase M50 [Pseudothermotoga lettingae TMO]